RVVELAGLADHDRPGADQEDLPDVGALRHQAGPARRRSAAPSWDRISKRRYILFPMTRALETAIAKLASLPADEQDRIAQWLLEELRDEEHWERQFAASQDALSRLAAEARTERAAGKLTDLDPDKL